jgi:hypothetical protein
MTRTRILAALAAGLVLAGAGTAVALADDSARPAPTVAAVADVSTSTSTASTSTASTSTASSSTANSSTPATVADDGGRTAAQYGRHGSDDGPGHVRHSGDDGPGHDLGDDRGGDR